jgi:hypothetical protein
MPCIFTHQLGGRAPKNNHGERRHKKMGTEERRGSGRGFLKSPSYRRHRHPVPQILVLVPVVTFTAYLRAMAASKRVFITVTLIHWLARVNQAQFGSAMGFQTIRWRHHGWRVVH